MANNAKMLAFTTRRFLFTLLSMLLCFQVMAQERFTLSGYVKGADDGEALIGAAVYVSNLMAGTTTNAYGYYALSLPAGTHQVEYSLLGYTSKTIEIDLSEDITMDMELSEESLELEEVVVRSDADDKNVRDVEMSVNRIDIRTIKQLPALLGEVEIIRTIQLLPGVTSVGEGANGFNVRGGSIDQNLVLLDEAPVFNSSHLFGFFSVFNPDAVKGVELYKGGIPSRYGGRLSSILDVRMKEGNNKRFSMNGGVGLIFSRLAIEAPLIKDKASFIVAGRRSYIDVLARPFLNEDLSGSVLNFYDLTVKANYTINENNRIFLSGYFGRDNFGFGESAGFNWGNGTATLRWNHLFNKRLFANFSFYYSDYDYELSFGEESTNSFDWQASIINYSFKPEFSYFIRPDNIIRFGGQGIIYDFKPGQAVGVSEGEVTDVSLDDKYAIEGALFIEQEVDLNGWLSAVYGLRYSYFAYTGKGRAYTFGEAIPGNRRPPTGFEDFGQWDIIEDYGNLEPRISVKAQLNDVSSIKASYNRMAQYIHLISNTTASTPLDVWIPSTNNVRPQVADQIAIGYFRNFNTNMYELSVEAYYKRMDRLVDFIDGADLLLNEFLEGDLLEGRGRAYGLEFLLKKSSGRLNGWMSYTLARSERQVDGINNDAWYPSRFDQTHNFSMTAFYDLSKRWKLSANFILNSGTPTTFPTNRFEQQGYIIPHNPSDSRNNTRIPTYHRLDLSATLAPKDNPDKRWKGELVFSIYNVYGRRNPFSIFFRQDNIRPLPNNPIAAEAIKLSVVGSLIPSVSYNFKF